MKPTTNYFMKSLASMRLPGGPLCLLAILASPAGPAVAADPVSPTELKELREAGTPLLVIDVRPETEFQQAHVEGSVNWPLPTLRHRRFPAGVSIVVVDDDLSGRSARAAAGLAESAGSKNVLTLAGGFTAWRMERGDAVADARAWQGQAVPFIRADDLAEVLAENTRAADGRSVQVFELCRDAAPKETEIPQATAIASAGKVAEPQRLAAPNSRTQSVYIFADDGTGEASRWAEAWSAQGADARVLAGGVHAWRMATANKEKAATIASNKGERSVTAAAVAPTAATSGGSGNTSPREDSPVQQHPPGFK